MYIIHYSVLGDPPERLPKTTTVVNIPISHGNSKKRFHLKETTKSSIKIMDISRMLNTDLGNLNDWSLILKDDCLSL